MSYTEVTRGQQVRLTITLTDSAGAAVDATGLRLRVMTPDGTEAEVTPLLSGGTGIAYGDFTPDAVGLHRYRAWRTDSPAVAAEGEFVTKATPFSDDA